MIFHKQICSKQIFFTENKQKKFVHKSLRKTKKNKKRDKKTICYK